MQATLILASASPRRRALLGQIGLQATVCPAQIDESVLPDETPAAYVARLAQEKAAAVARRSPGRVVLAADTAIAFAGQILGKPASPEQAVTMLTALSGKSHDVLTGAAIVYDHQCHWKVVSTRVRMRQLSGSQIRAYVATGEPLDKAGAYGIQGLGAVLIAGIEGSYSNVVGLPLAETADLLQQAGIDVLGQH
ncbi:Maf family protein [Granulosicoccaceae sp. 1_MG-2023]|nr:Maf family protein [Granulosicoccaceae sp. 1_MG-2023]